MEEETKDFMLKLSGILQTATAVALVYMVNLYHNSEETVRKYEEATPVIREINNAVLLVLQPNSFEDYGRLKQKLSAFQEICTKEDISSCVIPQMHKLIGVR